MVQGKGAEVADLKTIGLDADGGYGAVIVGRDAAEVGEVALGVEIIGVFECLVQCCKFYDAVQCECAHGVPFTAVTADVPSLVEELEAPGLYCIGARSVVPVAAVIYFHPFACLHCIYNGREVFLTGGDVLYENPFLDAPALADDVLDCECIEQP